MAATKAKKAAKSSKKSAVAVPSAKSSGPKVKLAGMVELPTPKRSASTRILPPSARLVVEVRCGLGVTRVFFSRMIGFSVRTISGWEAGRPLSEVALAKVMEMKRLRDALASRIRSGFIPKWLENPCEGLGGVKPVEILERGELDRLWRTVLLIGSGMPT